MSDEIKVPGCRICAIEQDFKRILEDSKGNAGNALAICYVVGFAEASCVPETMAKTFCPKHAGKVLRYATNLGKIVLEAAVKRGLDSLPVLPSPSDKGLN